MAKAISWRPGDELLEWVDGYVAERSAAGVSMSRTDWFAAASAAFRADCEAGVPEIRARAVAQSTVRGAPEDGVGMCLSRGDGKGHVWAAHTVDPLRSCVFGCGSHGREPDVQGQDGGGFIAEAGRSRAEMFAGMKIPMQNGTGDPAKAWPKGMPPAMAARAAEIVADKQRRDREAAKA